MHDDVNRPFEHGARIGGDGDAPGRVLCADDFTEVAAGLGGIAVDSTDDFERGFFAHQASDRSADRAYSELHDANLLPHGAFLALS